MKLRVKPIVQLPHKITMQGVSYSFGPDCEVPDDRGEKLIATHPNLFEEAKGEANLELYKFREDFKNATVAETINKLNDDQKLKVIDFAEALIAGKVQAESAHTHEMQDLDSLTLPELKAFAVDSGIDLGLDPKKNPIKKGELLRLIGERLREHASAPTGNVEVLTDEERELLEMFRSVPENEIVNVQKYLRGKSGK